VRNAIAVRDAVRGNGAEAVEVALIGRKDTVVHCHQDGGIVVEVQHGREVGMGVARDDLHGCSSDLPLLAKLSVTLSFLTIILSIAQTQL
jgi:hypothetical protein